MKSNFGSGILVSLWLCLSNITLASSLTDLGEGSANFSSEQVLNNDHGQYRHWLSIGRVLLNGSQCTGSLIDTHGTSTKRDGPAYVLTAGHCVDSNADRFTLDSPASGEVIFNYFKDTQSRQLAYPITRIVWGTRRGGDIAIVELDRSLKQLMDDGIMPLKLARQPIPIGSDVLIVGAPFFGFMMRVACKQGASADVFEAGFAWFDQLSNRCEGVRSGVSGSPVLTRYSNEILGVIGTTTRTGGNTQCAPDSPCEITNGIPRKSQGTNYATSAVRLAHCFRAGRFAPQDTNCPLGPPSDFEPRNDENYVRVARDKRGNFTRVQWKQTFTLDQPFHRIKYTRTLSDCANSEGYGPARPTHANDTDTSIYTLHAGPGFYFLCVVGQRHKHVSRNRWAVRNARVYWRWAQMGPINSAPLYRLFESIENTFIITPIDVASDQVEGPYDYKVVQWQGSDCRDLEGYQRLDPDLWSFTVSVVDGPRRVCLRGHDITGNPSPAADFQLPGSADRRNR